MAIDRSTHQPSPAHRRRLVAGGVVAAYAAFAVFAQLIGEDRPDRSELVRLDAFCTALYSDYEGLISRAAAAGGSFGGLGDDDQPFFTSFIDADLAPQEFRDEVDYLAEGIELAFAGNLGPGEVGPYIQAHADLRERAASTCDDAGQQIQIDDELPFGEPD